MFRERIRRISALVLALALAAGLATHGIGGSDVGFKSAVAAAASDVPMSGKSDGCGDDHQNGMAAACAAFCSSVVALPVAAVLQHLNAIDILRPSAGQDATGQVGPPDPYPPRPISMS
jgi:hypothetical protein